MTSLACSALPAIGPGALLRRGTHGCTPFSQHSACNIVFSPHNAALHTGFITPCQSAGGSGVSVQEQQDTGAVREARDVSVLYGLNVVLAVLMGPLMLLLRVDVCLCLYGCIWALLLCVCAIVRFIVNSRGILGCFQLSVLITGESDFGNCVCPVNRPSSTLKTCFTVCVCRCVVVWPSQ